MSAAVNPIPPGHEGVTPSLCCKNAAAAIDFYAAAFGAQLTMKLADPNGVVGHAEISIGRARFKLSGEYPDWGVLSPATIGGNPRTSSTATAAASCVTPTATPGRWPRTSRTSPTPR